MVAFPTPEWLDEYKKKLNESKDMEQAGKGWGVGWNGDFIFQIEELPIEKLDQLKDEKLKKKMKDLMAEYADGTTVYTFIGLKDGKCTDARVIKSPDEVEVGFKLIGSFENWKKLAKAETDATKLVLTRKMKLEGKMTMVMKYIKATQIMGRTASEVQTEFVDEMV
jgi:putative sterol carrier protein